VREALRMGRNGRGHVLDGIEPADVGESGRESADDATSNATPMKKASDRAQYATSTFRTVALAGRARVAPWSCVWRRLSSMYFWYFCTLLQRMPFRSGYSSQINGWIYPVSEQNWRLFAPDPESVTRQISARTVRTTPDGTRQVSDWFNLTAVDDSAVEHNVFPSHTTQNMLRRAWTSYLESHGSDDRSHSQRTLKMQKYLRATSRWIGWPHNATARSRPSSCR
jgi:hypothetical protein